MHSFIKIELGLDRPTLWLLSKLIGDRLSPEDAAALRDAASNLNAGTAATQAAIDDAAKSPNL
jgi:hypothetical protein